MQLPKWWGKTIMSSSSDGRGSADRQDREAGRGTKASLMELMELMEFTAVGTRLLPFTNLLHPT